MQQLDDSMGFTAVTPTAPIAADKHGARAKCLQRLVRLDMPVPQTLALDFATIRGIAAGQLPDLRGLLAEFGPTPLVSVRPSSQDPDWGGPGAFLNIGLNNERRDFLASQIGEDAANDIYGRFVQTFAIEIARLDPEPFEDVPEFTRESIEAKKAAYEAETETPFPEDAQTQLSMVLNSMVRAWDGTTARLLRQARGAPADAGLGLVVQSMVIGAGEGECGEGVIQFVDSDTGVSKVSGKFIPQCLDRTALKSAGARSIDDLSPHVLDELRDAHKIMRVRLREEMFIEFTLERGKLAILDAVRVSRRPRAGLKIAVDLAHDGVIPKEEALLRVDARTLTDLMHRHIAPGVERDVAIRGIAASPGAATGRIVFTSSEASAADARGEACVMVRRETSTDDVRGMHASVAVVTERGGLTSHAAVIARGFGVPCVVGASNMRIDRREATILTDDGRVLSAGDIVTVDGGTGEVICGAVDLLEPALDESFTTLMEWAEEARDIGIRVNADTPEEAELAIRFGAEGIGLTRTEHMFIDADRLTLMREMIFADTPEDRSAALDRLLPMQRSDFGRLFEIMQGRPVCIRLFDPPLHEFLPTGKEEVRELAGALGLPASDVTRRVQELSEYNPMLGMRGVRLGITVPEIYDMQAKAIFEATLDASENGAPIVPEIMIPLVSAKREVELVKARIDAVAATVRAERNRDFDYRLGVMVETPRAALRAEEIAVHSAFMSFGTNDLTQMTYGLSRDDAGRFMGAYVTQGVYAEDPFLVLDEEGVGELLKIGAERGRAGQPSVILSICGEHAGDIDSIAFTRAAGFDYVSCSPFRVPVAKLAAAQLAIQNPR